MIYLDHSATSPLLPEVKAKMTEIMGLDLGNPSSLHSAGTRAKFELNEARSKIAQLIGARPLELIFTSSGSESNNTVLHTFQNCPIFTSAIEHPSVLKPAETYGAPHIKIPVNQQGIIDLAFLETKLRETTTNNPKSKILVSIQLANNEIGTIEPIAKVSALIQQLKHQTNAKIYLHTDATQAVGKIPVNAKNLGIDYLTFTAHKLGGPIGIAALYVKTGAPFTPLILGGAQENHRRAGTSNVLLATGFATACELAEQNLEKYKKVEKLRNYLAKEIKNKIKSSIIVTPVRGETIPSRRHYGGYDRVLGREARNDGPERPVPTDGLSTASKKALPNILCVSFPAAEGESTQLYLDLEGIEVSTGSACASGDLEPSHVLMATHHDAEIAHGSVRFSLGLHTTRQEIDALLEKLPPIIAKIQDLSTLNKGKS